MGFSFPYSFQHELTTNLVLVFSTAADFQTAVEIKVFQGERELVRDNKLLGNFQLVGIPPAHRGIPQIEVTFDIDADSIVHVSAKDKATNKDQSITIASGSGLSDSEIKSMIDDAERYQEADKERKKVIELANRANSVVHDTESVLKDHESSINKTEAEAISEKITALREVIAKTQSGDSSVTSLLKDQTDALQMASLTLFDKVHRSRSEQQDSKVSTRSSEPPPSSDPEGEKE